LFNYAVDSPDYAGWSVNDDVKRRWNEAIVA
jgi:hypothetical protein